MNSFITFSIVIVNNNILFIFLLHESNEIIYLLFVIKNILIKTLHLI